jgi:hypothetical protein
MASNNDTISQGSGHGNDNEPTLNPQARVEPTPENPRGYPPFDMRFVSNYTNSQITYYFITGAIPAADQSRFHKLMKERKTSLNLIGWNGESDADEDNDDAEHLDALNHDSDSDSDCPASLPGYKGIKISPSDIPKLQYDSTVAQYTNWLADLKRAFKGDPVKYPTSSHKIILAAITLDDQLKTTHNSAIEATPILSQHWRKFERWIRDIVLHGGSDKSKLSNEFTAARQTFAEDPNQFHLRLFNLGIQSGRTVTIEDYRTRLLKPLRNMIDQHDREYHTVQDVVTHAGKLWQTLDKEKLRKEMKEERSMRRQRYENPKEKNTKPSNLDNDRKPSR